MLAWAVRRTLAAAFGCQVTALDLTEVYGTVGADLAARMRLSARVTFQHGNARAMPFPDNRFDLVWTRQSWMTIEDKPALLREFARVLHTVGRSVS